MNKIDSVNNEIFILGDFNINLYFNNLFISAKNIWNNKSIPSDIKTYHELYTFFNKK